MEYISFHSEITYHLIENRITGITFHVFGGIGKRRIAVRLVCLVTLELVCNYSGTWVRSWSATGGLSGKT